MKDDKNPGYKLHQCDFLPKQGVQVIYAKGYIPGRNKTWCLYIFREATESDLEKNHYLEEEGDLIWSTAIEISHCPYCGQSLFENIINRPIDFGKFTHTDFGSLVIGVIHKSLIFKQIQALPGTRDDYQGREKSVETGAPC